MLPPKHRLSGKQFPQIKKQGQKLHQTFFGVTYLPHQSVPKFGFVVSTKISKKATQRNTIKRLLRVAVSTHLKLSPSANIIFFANKNILNQTSDHISKAVEKSFKTIKDRTTNLKSTPRT